MLLARNRTSIRIVAPALINVEFDRLALFAEDNTANRITSGLTIGGISALLILGAIATIYIFMGMLNYNPENASLEQFTRLMMTFSPYLLIAYLTTMLSADLHYSKRMFKQLSEIDEMTRVENLRSF
jgi:peptidoglycan biosynthesis protein MviN/MurJ (putative lipid II flippase)